MMPKIYSVVKSVMSGKVKLAPSAHMHSGQLSHLLRHLCSISQSFWLVNTGYQHAFDHESPNLNAAVLLYFPSDSEIDEDLVIAHARATALCKCAGMEGIEAKSVFNSDISDTLPEMSACIDAEDGSSGKCSPSPYDTHSFLLNFLTNCRSINQCCQTIRGPVPICHL